MSIRWCGTPSRSFMLGLAVPMSMPRYTSAESMDTTSPPSAWASAMANPVLPEAVGPISAMARGFTKAARGALAAAQEQPVQVGERELVPGGAAMVALAALFGFFHLAQQRVHFRQ